MTSTYRSTRAPTASEAGLSTDGGTSRDDDGESSWGSSTRGPVIEIRAELATEELDRVGRLAVPDGGGRAGRSWSGASNEASSGGGGGSGGRRRRRRRSKYCDPRLLSDASAMDDDETDTIACWSDELGSFSDDSADPFGGGGGAGSSDAPHLSVISHASAVFDAIGPDVLAALEAELVRVDRAWGRFEAGASGDGGSAGDGGGFGGLPMGAPPLGRSARSSRRRTRVTLPDRLQSNVPSMRHDALALNLSGLLRIQARLEGILRSSPDQVCCDVRVMCV